MKIDVTKHDDGAFGLTFDGNEVSLSAQDMKMLLLQITQILAPGPEVARKIEADRQRFLERLKGAIDVDLQIFIQAADHDDVVVLLKAAEDDQAAREKLFRNMSENSRKMFIEDMEFRFREDVPVSQFSAALSRLHQTAEELRSDGRADL